MTDACLWTGGRVFAGGRYAEALLVEDGRVLGAGPAETVRRLAPTGAERRDLAGRLIVPGLIDAHLHLTEIARVATGLDVAPARSAEGLAGLLARWADAHPVGPIVGRGWDPERWTDRRWPEARGLDAVVRDRAVVLYHASGHALVANSAALVEAGADPSKDAPDDPAVGRYGDGRPNGLLFEGAMRALAPLSQTATPVGADLLERTIGQLPSLGITAAGSMSSSPEEVAALRDLAAAGRLPITVRAYVRLSELGAEASYPAPTAAGRFAVAGVKAYLDGAFGTRTAWLAEPYADAPGQTGIAVRDDRLLLPELVAAVDRGLAPALHAIGDRALARALRLLEPLTGRTEAPVRVEHAALTPPHLLSELDRVRPTLVVQPGFVWSDDWLARCLGAERARWAYAFRTLGGRGVRLAASSDAPFDPVDPWRGLRAAADRRNRAGRSANPDPGEALSPEEALHLYTAGAAASLGLASRGCLEPGSAADFLVLSVPDLAEALHRQGPVVDETWVDGRRIHRAGGGAEA
ncbi:MAG: amidohydrolase [Thermoplasmata archaeon]